MQRRFKVCEDVRFLRRKEGLQVILIGLYSGGETASIQLMILCITCTRAHRTRSGLQPMHFECAFVVSKCI